jgi:hypothetical protein
MLTLDMGCRSILELTHGSFPFPSEFVDLFVSVSLGEKKINDLGLKFLLVKKNYSYGSGMIEISGESHSYSKIRCSLPNEFFWRDRFDWKLRHAWT